MCTDKIVRQILLLDPVIGVVVRELVAVEKLGLAKMRGNDLSFSFFNGFFGGKISFHSAVGFGCCGKHNDAVGERRGGFRHAESQSGVDASVCDCRCHGIGKTDVFVCHLRNTAACADEIAAFSDQVDRCFMEYFNEQTEWIQDAGYTGWIPLVHNKTWYPLQCDFSAMISPKMFERLVLPSLENISSQMGTSVYHLDGPGEIVHLDMILSVPNIHAIQWVPLPDVHLEKGNYHQCFDDEMSLDIYRRVLKAGRKVVLCGVPAYQIENIFRAVGSDGIFIFGGGVNNQEAKDLIEKLCRDGWLRP